MSRDGERTVFRAYQYSAPKPEKHTDRKLSKTEQLHGIKPNIYYTNDRKSHEDDMPDTSSAIM